MYDLRLAAMISFTLLSKSMTFFFFRLTFKTGSPKNFAICSPYQLLNPLWVQKYMPVRWQEYGSPESATSPGLFSFGGLGIGIVRFYLRKYWMNGTWHCWKLKMDYFLFLFMKIWCIPLEWTHLSTHEITILVIDHSIKY